MSDVIPDPLATLDAHDRVHFSNGQLLDAQDFRDEQDYHRSRLARALAYVHGPGTVAGARVTYEGPLEPGEDTQLPAGRPERIRVGAGLVIDRLGRLIEIPRSVCLRLDDWYAQQPPEALHAALALGNDQDIFVDVFVAFRNCGRGRTPSFDDRPGNALDKVSFARVRDGYEVQAVLRDSVLTDLPLDPWAEVADEPDPASRLARLRELVLDGWRESSEHWINDVPPPGREHDATQDPTSVFLARLALRAVPSGETSERPDRELDGGGKPVVTGPDNDGRLFVFTTAAIRHLLAP